jgi:hypothetical protein
MRMWPSLPVRGTKLATLVEQLRSSLHLWLTMAKASNRDHARSLLRVDFDAVRDFDLSAHDESVDEHEQGKDQEMAG